MGGDSPMRLMRLPGEPASPGTPLTHSFVLGAVLVAKEAVDTASRSGEVARPPLVGGLAGFSSGDWREGEDASEAEALLPVLPTAALPLTLPLLSHTDRS